ncbi:MAG: hypothetical protein AAB281_05610 [Actinomycetota bacterium]
MTKLQLAKARQKFRALKVRRTTLEYIALGPHPMVQGCLIQRRFRGGQAVCHYLGIPTPQGSWPRYVRKDELEYFRRRVDRWREYTSAMAEWVRIDKEIAVLLRQLGKGRCEKVEIRRGNKRLRPWSQRKKK